MFKGNVIIFESPCILMKLYYISLLFHLLSAHVSPVYLLAHLSCPLSNTTLSALPSFTELKLSNGLLLILLSSNSLYPRFFTPMDVFDCIYEIMSSSSSCSRSLNLCFSK